MTSLALELANASVTPDLIRGPVVEAKSKKVSRSRKIVLDEDELDLIAAK